MYRIATIAVACATIAACAGEAIKKGMTALQGQPLNAAIAKLGVPTEERTIAGQKVYIGSREPSMKARNISARSEQLWPAT
jgi:hypothetical protein